MSAARRLLDVKTSRAGCVSGTVPEGLGTLLAGTHPTEGCAIDCADINALPPTVCGAWSSAEPGNLHGDRRPMTGSMALAAVLVVA